MTMDQILNEIKRCQVFYLERRVIFSGLNEICGYSVIPQKPSSTLLPIGQV